MEDDPKAKLLEIPEENEDLYDDNFPEEPMIAKTQSKKTMMADKLDFITYLDVRRPVSKSMRSNLFSHGQELAESYKDVKDSFVHQSSKQVDWVK